MTPPNKPVTTDDKLIESAKTKGLVYKGRKFVLAAWIDTRERDPAFAIDERLKLRHEGYKPDEILTTQQGHLVFVWKIEKPPEVGK